MYRSLSGIKQVISITDCHDMQEEEKKLAQRFNSTLGMFEKSLMRKGIPIQGTLPSCFIISTIDTAPKPFVRSTYEYEIGGFIVLNVSLRNDKIYAVLKQNLVSTKGNVRRVFTEGGNMAEYMAAEKIYFTDNPGHKQGGFEKDFAQKYMNMVTVCMKASNCEALHPNFRDKGVFSTGDTDGLIKRHAYVVVDEEEGQWRLKNPWGTVPLSAPIGESFLFPRENFGPNSDVQFFIDLDDFSDDPSSGFCLVANCTKEKILIRQKELKPGSICQSENPPKLRGLKYLACNRPACLREPTIHSSNGHDCLNEMDVHASGCGPPTDFLECEIVANPDLDLPDYQSCLNWVHRIAGCGGEIMFGLTVAGGVEFTAGGLAFYMVWGEQSEFERLPMTHIVGVRECPDGENVLMLSPEIEKVVTRKVPKSLLQSKAIRLQRIASYTPEGEPISMTFEHLTLMSCSLSSLLKVPGDLISIDPDIVVSHYLTTNECPAVAVLPYSNTDSASLILMAVMRSEFPLIHSLYPTKLKKIVDDFQEVLHNWKKDRPKSPAIRSAILSRLNFVGGPLQVCMPNDPKIIKLFFGDVDQWKTLDHQSKNNFLKRAQVYSLSNLAHSDEMVDQGIDAWLRLFSSSRNCPNAEDLSRLSDLKLFINTSDLPTLLKLDLCTIAEIKTSETLTCELILRLNHLCTNSIVKFSSVEMSIYYRSESEIALPVPGQLLIDFVGLFYGQAKCMQMFEIFKTFTKVNVPKFIPEVVLKEGFACTSSLGKVKTFEGSHAWLERLFNKPIFWYKCSELTMAGKNEDKDSLKHYQLYSNKRSYLAETTCIFPKVVLDCSVDCVMITETEVELSVIEVLQPKILLCKQELFNEKYTYNETLENKWHYYSSSSSTTLKIIDDEPEIKGEISELPSVQELQIDPNRFNFIHQKSFAWVPLLQGCVCPICKEAESDVMLICGHIGCFDCFKLASAQALVCPTCQRDISCDDELKLIQKNSVLHLKSSHREAAFSNDSFGLLAIHLAIEFCKIPVGTEAQIGEDIARLRAAQGNFWTHQISRCFDPSKDKWEEFLEKNHNPLHHIPKAHIAEVFDFLAENYPSELTVIILLDDVQLYQSLILEHIHNLDFRKLSKLAGAAWVQNGERFLTPFVEEEGSVTLNIARLLLASGLAFKNPSIQKWESISTLIKNEPWGKEGQLQHLHDNDDMKAAFIGVKKFLFLKGYNLSQEGEKNLSNLKKNKVPLKPPPPWTGAQLFKDSKEIILPLVSKNGGIQAAYGDRIRISYDERKSWTDTFTLVNIPKDGECYYSSLGVDGEAARVMLGELYDLLTDVRDRQRLKPFLGDGAWGGEALDVLFSCILGKDIIKIFCSKTEERVTRTLCPHAHTIADEPPIIRTFSKSQSHYNVLEPPTNEQISKRCSRMKLCFKWDKYVIGVTTDAQMIFTDCDKDTGRERHHPLKSLFPLPKTQQEFFHLVHSCISKHVPISWEDKRLICASNGKFVDLIDGNEMSYDEIKDEASIIFMPNGKTDNRLHPLSIVIDTWSITEDCSSPQSVRESVFSNMHLVAAHAHGLCSKVCPFAPKNDVICAPTDPFPDFSYSALAILDSHCDRLRSMIKQTKPEKIKTAERAIKERKRRIIPQLTYRKSDCQKDSRLIQKTMHLHLVRDQDVKPFYGASNPFSQFYKRKFEVDGREFSCMEQYMMFSKASFFDNENIAERIMRENDPREMKSLGRTVKPFSESEWARVCLKIVSRGNYNKFSQNPDLKEALFESYPKILVEGSPRDCIWGVGLGVNDPAIHDPGEWQGLNCLGYVLTDVRNELMTEAEILDSTEQCCPVLQQVLDRLFDKKVLHENTKSLEEFIDEMNS